MFLQLIWTSSLFFAPNQLCAKLSILRLYSRIFGINPTYARCIKAIALFQILWSIETPLVEAFECTPVYKYWDLTYRGGSCINIGPYLAANETLNSLADFMLAALAVVMLRHLQTSARTKWRLGVVFAVGGLAGIIGFIKIGLAFNVSVHNQIQMGLWATLQMAFSIICCCVITYGPLFAKTGIGHRHQDSRLSMYGGKQGTSRSGHELMSAYVDLEGDSHSRSHCATEISTGNAASESNGDQHALASSSSGNGWPMRTVQIDQRIESLGS
jgi:hypothetical protein